jgi:UV DNA damage endonuclease
MIRLGFPVRIVGQPALRSHDGRRGAARHLSVGLVYLRDILTYLQRIGVSFYRIASALLPGLPYTAALSQLHECQPELAVVAELLQAQQVRLTLHLDHGTLLTHADAAVAARALEAIELRAALLHHLGTPAEAVLVMHLGSSAHDSAALERFTARWLQLSAVARARLVLEHDETHSLGALLHLHQQCGIPIVFDYLHWLRHNPERLPLDLALGLALATWPPEVRPEVHLSTARSEAHLVPPHQGHAARVVPPRPGQHADFIAASDLIALLEAARGLPDFDLMLEAKAGDLALLRVRHELAQLAPHLAARLA